jgi:hypothetical protein
MKNNAKKNISADKISKKKSLEKSRKKNKNGDIRDNGHAGGGPIDTY